MKKIVFYLVLALIFISAPVYAAQSVKVSALTPFNSLRPVTTMKVMTLERVEFKNGIVFEDGTVIYGEVFDVKQPKRAKLNASFKFRPTSYTYNGRTYEIDDPEFIAKYAEYKELDKAGLATSAATTAGGLIFHIPLLSEGVSLVKGMWKNNENNRLKSGVKQVWDDSFFSYVEEGNDVVINKDTMFILKFKSSDSEDLDSPPANNVAPVENTSNGEQPVSVDNVINVNSVVTPVPHEENIKNIPIKTVHPEEVLLEVENAQNKTINVK
ncbi:MAG: hypothetical protein KHX03_00850 [Clostridium sp.]|nr:hypothetical protein [Clostridium sp.]